MDWSDEDCMKVDEDKCDLSIVIPPLGQLNSILWQASVPRGISRLLSLLPYYLTLSFAGLLPMSSLVSFVSG